MCWAEEEALSITLSFFIYSSPAPLRRCISSLFIALIQSSHFLHGVGRDGGLRQMFICLQRTEFTLPQLQCLLVPWMCLKWWLAPKFQFHPFVDHHFFWQRFHNLGVSWRVRIIPSAYSSYQDYHDTFQPKISCWHHHLQILWTQQQHIAVFMLFFLFFLFWPMASATFYCLFSYYNWGAVSGFIFLGVEPSL